MNLRPRGVVVERAGANADGGRGRRTKHGRRTRLKKRTRTRMIRRPLRWTGRGARAGYCSVLFGEIQSRGSRKAGGGAGPQGGSGRMVNVPPWKEEARS